MASTNLHLYEIEKNKKKAHLAHELGAGSSCNVCKENCPGFDLHYWRKICKNCKCGKKEHGVTEEEDVGFYRIGKLFGQNDARHKSVDDELCSATNRKLTLTSNGNDANQNKSLNVSYDWLPPGTSAEVALSFMEQLPKSDRPVSGSVGALNRKHLLELQLPLHDLESSRCHDLTTEEIQKMNIFVENCKKNIVGIGMVRENTANEQLVCKSCPKPILRGDISVFADRAECNTTWHPLCFKCNVCDERLVDLIYFHKNCRLFCGRHFAELDFSRCSACDELIFTPSYTQAEGKSWHIKHFCCYDCDRPLANMNYVPDDDCHPHCLDCFSKKCCTCSQKIDVDAKRVSFKNSNWHASENCFRCSSCKVSLLGKRFLAKDNYIFCSVDCKKKIFPS